MLRTVDSAIVAPDFVFPTDLMESFKILERNKSLDVPRMDGLSDVDDSEI